jgi:hypothetical protein
MMRVACIAIAAMMTCFGCMSNAWAQAAPKPAAAAKKPQPAAKQGIPIVVRGSSETEQADAALVLAVNWTFSGSQSGMTQPSVDVIDQATADHPAGGIKISSPARNGQPLAFFLDFTETKSLMRGPSVKGMGTE